jgi:hypothetical protein
VIRSNPENISPNKSVPWLAIAVASEAQLVEILQNMKTKIVFFFTKKKGHYKNCRNELIARMFILTRVMVPLIRSFKSHLLFSMRMLHRVDQLEFLLVSKIQTRK